MPDAEVGHILTNLYGATSSRPELPHPQYSSNAALTPSSSAPTAAQNPQHVSPAQNQNQSGLKRSRSRPTKSCEECRRKKLKCDRELPCSNCNKGGRDGSTCFFKDGPGTSDDRPGKSIKFDEGQSGQMYRPQQDFQQTLKLERPVDKYPSAPKSVRTDPIGPDRGSLAHGMIDFAPSKALPRDWSNEAQTPVSTPGRRDMQDNGSGWGVLAYSRNDVVSSKAPAKSWINEEPTPVSIQGQWQSNVQDDNARALGRIHVKGTRSRYVGIGDRMAMLDHFEDSKGFILDSLKDPEMSGMMHELIAYQNAFQPKHKYDHTIPHDGNELMAEMIKALPSGFLFDILQRKYISNWETIWRVLHIGTFMKECDQVIQVRDSGSFTLPPHVRDSVVPQILSILSTVSRLHDPNDRGATTEKVSDEQISKNCQMVQAWLDGLHEKALVDFHTLQTRTLLLLARQANLATPSELWVESGSLVRNAMIMGLHQDPETWDEISKFDKEQRRKLWMTILELDLQFSLGAGMPGALSANSFTCRELVNVDDHDLAQDMTEYPESKPLTVWTHALPQIALAASLKERLQIINILGGNLNLERDAPMLLHQASLLEKVLLSLPTQFRSSTRAGNNSNKRLYRLFTSITIDVSIRRPLLTLYRIISMSPLSSRYPEARKGALRSALAILSHLDALDPSVADLNIVKSRDYLNLFHILRKNDILQAVLILCYEIKSYNSSHHSTSTASSENPQDLEPMPEEEFPQTQYSLTRVVENTLNSFLQRLGEFGSDLKDVLPVSVALQAVRSDGTPGEKKALMVRGAERVLDACRKARPDIRDSVARDGGAKNCGGLESNQSLNAGWNGDTCRPRSEMKNGGVEGYNRFNMIPDDDLNFENFDFGFFDGGISQSWL